MSVAAVPPVDEGVDDVEERIYRSVFDGVMNQRLAPGTKLPEAALCELFQVSRSVVRKVLQRLAHDRIVDLRPNKGAVVASPTPEETRQIFEARRALEAAIMRLAVRNATPQDIADLRQRMGKEHEAMHRFDQPAWARLASSFHLRLAEVAGNEMLQRYLTELVSRCSLIVALYEPPGNASCEHDEHEALVGCIERRDAEGAVRLMEEHLQVLERNVRLQQETPERSLARMLGLG
ncbi:GntR family transcriptional regulator [uncultured Ramlibacter sp.]|uniref:GntR family transcriptional regulator n=1 Tax=uncultured Ramlibacter sp. TaxID=260755 RepID=UPI00263894A6|nr:GntR family transcriptional regulator [uncultured Ramlibacter sp.]